MASRCSSSVLCVMMIILLALECSSAEFYQGNLGTESNKDVLLQSDSKSLLGRKMLQELDGKQVHIPGKSKAAIHLDNSFPQLQTEYNQVQAQQQHSQNSILNEAKRDDSMSEKHDESKEFLEATDEVANLMRKDYRGMARRKPPIHNHEPND